MLLIRLVYVPSVPSNFWGIGSLTWLNSGELRSSNGDQLGFSYSGMGRYIRRMSVLLWM